MGMNEMNAKTNIEVGDLVRISTGPRTFAKIYKVWSMVGGNAYVATARIEASKPTDNEQGWTAAGNLIPAARPAPLK